MSPESISILSQDYQKANTEFSNAMDNKSSLSEKLSKLEALGDAVGENIANSNHFLDTILNRWVKTKDPELYGAYMESQKMAA